MSNEEYENKKIMVDYYFVKNRFLSEFTQLIDLITIYKDNDLIDEDDLTDMIDMYGYYDKVDEIVSNHNMLTINEMKNKIRHFEESTYGLGDDFDYHLYRNNPSMRCTGSHCQTRS